MGFFSRIRQIANAVAESRRMARLSAEELLALDDEDLRRTLSVRLAYENRWRKGESDASSYGGAKRVFYTVSRFQQEIQNGGLCQFFVNPTRLSAPFVAESLSAIGAADCAKLYTDFLSANNIDASDVSAFSIRDLSQFQALNARYPFAVFDSAFCELDASDPLDKKLFAYVREHIAEFATANA